MSEEWFDVVDAHDRVVGRETRAQVHALGLRHRAVHLLLFDRAGRIFLQKRSASKDMHPDCWDSSCSGHLDSGEDYDAAAVRELGEELGVEAGPGHALQLETIAKVEACPETDAEFVTVYAGVCEGPWRLHPDEISEARFFERAELDQLLRDKPDQFAPAFRFIWKCFAERMGTRLALY